MNTEKIEEVVIATQAIPCTSRDKFQPDQNYSQWVYRGEIMKVYLVFGICIMIMCWIHGYWTGKQNIDNEYKAMVERQLIIGEELNTQLNTYHEIITSLDMAESVMQEDKDYWAAFYINKDYKILDFRMYDIEKDKLFGWVEKVYKELMGEQLINVKY